MLPAEITPEKKGMPAKEFRRRFRNKRAHELGTMHLANQAQGIDL